ncbi:MAG: TonB-dependent receptor plug domain-containing protein, partial [Pyrinomonadaceae bacterium]
TYTVAVDLSGFERNTKQITVLIGVTADLNIDLTPHGVSEQVDVISGDIENNKTDSTVTGQITTSVLRNAPLINERFQDALPLLPGVVRGPDGLLNIKGTRATQSGVLVSDLNATDPVTGIAAIELPIEAVESIDVYANPFLSQYGNFAGAVTSIETRAGTDKWRYLLTNVLPRLRRRDGATVGIESVTPRIAVGGPLIKERLYFFQEFEYRFVRTEVPSLPQLQRDTKRESFETFTRLDYNINATNSLTLNFAVTPQKLDFFNLNTFNPQETTSNFHQRGGFLTLREQAVMKNGGLLQSNLNLKLYDADIFSNSSAPYVIAPERNFGGWFNRQQRESRRYELLETYNFPLKEWRGTHSLKIGVDLDYAKFQGSDVGSPVTIRRADATTSQRIEFIGSGNLRSSNTAYAGFIQDKWTLNRWLIIDAGLRYDGQRIDSAQNIAPRFGFVLLPFKNERTVIRGGFGLFYDKIPLGVASFDQQQNMQVTDFASDGTALVSGSTFFRNVIDGGRLKAPRSVAGNLQFDHEITSRLLLRLGFEERKTTRDFLIQTGLIQTGFDSTDSPALILSNSGSSRYREMEVTTRYRFRENQNLSISYVRSRATGDLNDFNTYFGNFREPVIRPNENSLLPFDAPNRLLLTGEVSLPKRIVLSPVLDWHTGFPFSLVDENQNFIGVRNRGGRFPRYLSLDLQVTKGVSIPIPSFSIIPTSFRGKKISGRIGVKMFNITNHWNPRDVQDNIDSPLFGTFFNSVRRSFRAKFELVKF